MFYDKYIEFCNRMGKTPSSVAKEIGFNEASVTGWKKGSRPRDANLQKIADYFGVSTIEFIDTNELYENPDPCADFKKLKNMPRRKEAMIEDIQRRRKNSKAATPEGSGLTEEFARIFVQLTPENQNKIIAEMLKRQRNQ